MLFGESRGIGRKDFDKPVRSTPSMNRQNSDGTQANAATDFDIDERIILGIGALLSPSGA